MCNNIDFGNPHNVSKLNLYRSVVMVLMLWLESWNEGLTQEILIVNLKFKERK